MTIEIDPEMLKKAQLSPDEFVYLTFLHRKLPCPLTVNVDLSRLEDLLYIKNTEDGPILRSGFIDMVESDFDQMFTELVVRYPFKVGTPGNIRTLRAHDPKAKANEIARARYQKVVKNKPDLHRKILTLLDVQLENMKKNLQYLPALDVWINQRAWEKWEGIKKDTSDGTRITRILD